MFTNLNHTIAVNCGNTLCKNRRYCRIYSRGQEKPGGGYFEPEITLNRIPASKSDYASYSNSDTWNHYQAKCANEALDTKKKGKCMRCHLMLSLDLFESVKDDVCIACQKKHGIDGKGKVLKKDG